jgi:photosystem II stability/assembly factor-like uncharacterized protein
MRGEKDARDDRDPAKRPPRRGGKALQRLFLFNGTRDPLLNEAVVGRSRAPKLARPRWLLTEAGLAMASEDGVPRRSVSKAAALAGDLVQAAAARAAAPPPPAGAPIWRSLGPDRIPNGQTYGSNRVDVIGRVAAIAVDPSNIRHVLLGAAGGGVWESFDEGATWTVRTDRMPTLAIGALAFDPVNPSNVYAGSGEGNFYARLGAGVFKSSDGGTTWSAPPPGPLLGNGFYDLAIDRGDPNVLYGATSGGFFVSTNAGGTWVQRRAGTCWAVSVDPAGGAGAELLVAFADGLFRSTNRGAALSKVALPQEPISPWSRLAVTRVASQPDVAYAFGAAGANAFLWRRAGTQWSRISLPPKAAGKPMIDTGQAWYDWYAAAPPDRADRVYLGAIDGFRGDLANGAWTWRNFVTQGSHSVHPDQHCMAFAPGNSKIVYIGNDGGIFRSADGGGTWRALNSGLAITEVEYIALNPANSNWLLAGTQDNGTIRLNGGAWEHVADGDGGDCGLNAGNPKVVYHSYYNVSLERSNKKGDAGSWTGMAPPTMKSLFYPPVAVANDTVAIGGVQLAVTRNGAPPWAVVSLGLGSGDVCTAGCAPSAGMLYFGTLSGRLFRLEWNGGAWTRTELTAPFQAYISCVAADSQNLARLWATSTQSHPGGAPVARSDDRGATWTDCTAGLPPIAKNSIVVDPAASNRVWVAADVGVYESLDAGATWASISNGLPNAIAADLNFHAASRRLICGTRNRGVWSLDGL